MLQKELVSICVVSYNQEKYIADTLNSVLNQTYSPLEIIISDDHSTDGTFDIINSIVKEYKGPHNIILNQNTKNMGVINHINLIFQKFLRSDLLILNAGDDISYPERTTQIKSYFDRNANIFAVCSNAKVIDSDGNFTGSNFKDDATFDVEPRGFLDVWNKGTQVFGAATAYRKDVFFKFGPLKTTIRNEDFILPSRASLIGKVGYIDQPLIGYRKHDTNLSFWVQFENAKSIDEFKKLSIKHWNNLVANLIHLKNDIKTINSQEGLSKLNEIDKRINKMELRIKLINSNLKNRITLISKHLGVVDKHSLLILFSPKLYLKILEVSQNT